MAAFDKAWKVVKARRYDPENPTEDTYYPPMTESSFHNWVVEQGIHDSFFSKDGPFSTSTSKAIEGLRNAAGGGDEILHDNLAEHWHQSNTCDCNAENDALEGLSDDEVREAAWSDRGHPRRLKWQKASELDEKGYYSRCGHCGGQATLDLETGEWGQFF